MISTRTRDRYLTRRQAMAAACAAGVAGRWTSPSALYGAGSLDDQRDLIVKSIRRTTYKIPFRPAPTRAMDREIPHWRYIEICDVELSNGVHGYGETLLYYTWGVTDDADIQRVQGKNAAAVMWDDGQGAGLQMALFDAVARSLEVPIHRLFGQQVNDVTPLSWWNIDMAPADMADECAFAYRSGYLAYKTKGRPWFDLWNQMDAATAVVPAEFKIDMDFNDTLWDAEHALPILRRLAKYPQTDIYETPIPQSDIPGNEAICREIDVNVAMHYGSPAPVDTVRHHVCDGYVIGGGASRLMQQAHFAATADLPFWLQLVGTGITAAYSLQFAAVLSHAKWPAVNCHQLYVHPVLTRPIQVVKGMADIPTGPGLGYEVDFDGIAKYQVEKPQERPNPDRLIETIWDSGKVMYIGNDDSVNFMIRKAMERKIPFYESGAATRIVPNDGSDAWRRMYDQARRDPVLTDERLFAN